MRAPRARARRGHRGSHGGGKSEAVSGSAETSSAQVYAEQEAARKKVLDERAALLKEARNKAAAEVAAGKDAWPKELRRRCRSLRLRWDSLAAGNRAAGTADLRHGRADHCERGSMTALRRVESLLPARLWLCFSQL